jgi:hypothetical protein
VEPNFALPKTCSWATWREESLVVLAPRQMASQDLHRLLVEGPFVRYDRRQWGSRLADAYLQHIDFKFRTDMNSIPWIRSLRLLTEGLVFHWCRIVRRLGPKDPPPKVGAASSVSKTPYRASVAAGVGSYPSGASAYHRGWKVWVGAGEP